MTWRDTFRPIIAGVLEANKDAGDVAIRAALRAAWRKQDLGPTAGSGAAWPYKVWCEEIRRQRMKIEGKDPVRTGRNPKGAGRKLPTRTLRSMTAAQAREWLKQRQMKLFEGES